HPTPMHIFEKSLTSLKRPLRGLGLTGFQVRDAFLDPLHEKIMIAMLVLQRFAGLSAAAANFVGKLDHLIDGLPAVEAHDKLLDGRRQLAFALLRSRLAQH